MINVPEEFARATEAREGHAGQVWIKSLPEMVETLCRKWGLIVDGSPVHGGLSLVVPVSRQGEACVLKIGWVKESYTGQAAALAAWDGNGAVRLLKLEPRDNAMLLERLDHTRTLESVDLEEALIIAGRLLRRLAIQAPDGVRSSRAWAEDAARNMAERWERYGRPMPRTVLERARELALASGNQCKVNLLANFDLHYSNVLAGKREPWLAIDPMVVAGDPEFALAQLIWTRLEEIEARSGLDLHFRALVEAAELDMALSRAWTLVRCVDYWLWGLTVGLTYDPARCEIIVNWLLKEDTRRTRRHEGRA